jgi:uncharacterized protein YndB with AHSA1/START domain
MIRALAAAGLWLLAAGAGAAEFRTLELIRQEQTFRVESDVYLAAPPSGVYRVLSDYDDFERLSSVFVESRMLEPIENGTGIVFFHMKGCVLFFCREVRLIERIDVVPETRIEVTIIPERSEMRRGWARWDIEPDGEGTLVRYVAEVEPEFWIPPLIGPLVIRAALLTRGARAARRLEALAAGRPIPPELVVRRP